MVITFFFFFLTLYIFLLLVMRPDGKGSRPYVFSLIQNNAAQGTNLLDVAANSMEELKEWVVKIHDVAATSEAKVKTHTNHVWQEMLCVHSNMKPMGSLVAVNI